MLGAGSVDIPVEIVIGADTLATLARIANALESTGTSAADLQTASVKTLGTGSPGVASAARNMNEVAEFAGRMGAGRGAADAITGSPRNSNDSTRPARLGLDFRQSAEQAGGFVSELQTMTLAASLADRGIRATQKSSTRSRASACRALSAQGRTSTRSSTRSRTPWWRRRGAGEVRGELLRVADGSHVRRTSARWFVDHARRVSPAMRTAADGGALSQRTPRAQRTLASAFTRSSGGCLISPTDESSADRAAAQRQPARREFMTANSGGVVGTAALRRSGSSSRASHRSLPACGFGAGSGRSRTGIPEGDRRAMARGPHMGPRSFLGQTGQFTQDAWRRLATLTSDAPRRPSAGEHADAGSNARSETVARATAGGRRGPRQ